MSKELSTLIKKGKYDYVNSDITQENFPDTGERGEVQIIKLRDDITSEESIEELKKQGLRPANIYELLEWGAKNTEPVSKWTYAVALGSSWQDLDGGRSGAFVTAHL